MGTKWGQKRPFRGKDSVNSLIWHLCTPHWWTYGTLQRKRRVDERPLRESIVCPCVCVLVCTCISVCKHAYKQFYFCVCIQYMHIRVCLCVQISMWASYACLYLYLVIINLIGLKGPLSPFTVASDHWGHSWTHSTRTCKTVLPQMQVFLHLIVVKYTRYVVPCLSHDRVKEMFRYEELMCLFLYCDGDRHTVTVG